MGALRAAEMGHYGMTGVGRIFKMYASGEVQGDDEVALVFDPETMEPLSEPLVNLRSLLDAAWMADIIDTAQRAEILSEMRSNLLSPPDGPGLPRSSPPERGRKECRGIRPVVLKSFDLKRSDAIRY